MSMRESSMVERLSAVLEEVAYVDYQAGYAITNQEEVVRAMLAAMREPTITMVDAAHWTDQLEDDRAMHRGVALATWTDMIDAALNEAPSTVGEGE